MISEASIHGTREFSGSLKGARQKLSQMSVERGKQCVAGRLYDDPVKLQIKRVVPIDVSLSFHFGKSIENGFQLADRFRLGIVGDLLDRRRFNDLPDVGELE